MNAVFIHDPATGLYYPANKMAVLGSGKKLRLTMEDLLCIKEKGIKTTLTSGEEILLSLPA